MVDVRVPYAQTYQTPRVVFIIFCCLFDSFGGKKTNNNSRNSGSRIESLLGGRAERSFEMEEKDDGGFSPRLIIFFIIIWFSLNVLKCVFDMKTFAGGLLESESSKEILFEGQPNLS